MEIFNFKINLSILYLYKKIMIQQSNRVELDLVPYIRI